MLKFSKFQTNLRRYNCSKLFLARHGCCDVYWGARETVGESSVSSGCWGEDSDHEYGWARRTPTFVAPIRFYLNLLQNQFSKTPRDRIRIPCWVIEFAV